MNLAKKLFHLASLSTRDRQTGRTSRLCQLTKELGGIILAANFEQAKMLNKEFGVIAKSVDINLDGYSGPFIFDHYAVETLLFKASDRINEDESIIRSQNGEIGFLRLALLAQSEETKDYYIKLADKQFEERK